MNLESIAILNKAEAERDCLIINVKIQSNFMESTLVKIFFSCLGGEAERGHTQQILDRSARFIYGLIKKRFHLKVIPQLHFHFDQSIEGTIVLEDAFQRLKPPKKPGE